MKRKTKRTKIGTIFDVLKLNFKFVSVKDKTELIFDPRGKHGPRLEQFLMFLKVKKILWMQIVSPVPYSQGVPEHCFC